MQTPRPRRLWPRRQPHSTIVLISNISNPLLQTAKAAPMAPEAKTAVARAAAAQTATSTAAAAAASAGAPVEPPAHVRSL
eukprot:1161587-Pelagomonas_calceolata.AAC.23